MIKINHQQELPGVVDKASLMMHKDEGDWCWISFEVNDNKTGCFLKEVRGWYCFSYGKLMTDHCPESWNRKLHSDTHRSLSKVM